MQARREPEAHGDCAARFGKRPGFELVHSDRPNARQIHRLGLPNVVDPFIQPTGAAEPNAQRLPRLKFGAALFEAVANINELTHRILHAIRIICRAAHAAVAL